MSNSSKQTSGLSAEKRALFALLLKQAGVADRAEAAIPRRAGSGPAPLSFAQQRMWFAHQIAPESSAYTIFSAVRLTGRLDVVVLRRSLEEVVRRHESLRTTFIVVDDQPVQVIAPAHMLTIPIIDLRALPADVRATTAQCATSAAAAEPFDLMHGPLFRIQLLWLDESEYILLVALDHIVSDGWSVGILLREIATLYDAFARGQPSPLPELPIQYADFAVWQREWLEGKQLERQLGYWRAQLAGAPELLELPLDHPRPPVQRFRGARRSFLISASLINTLRALSRAEGATLFMVLMATFQTLLHRYSGQPDILVGSGIANRPRRETEGLIGCLINILLFRADFSRDLSFRQLLTQVRKTVLEAQDHQDLPFEKLVEALQVKRDLSYNPLAQVMLVLLSAPTAGVALPGVKMQSVEAMRLDVQLDLLLYFTESADDLHGALQYNTDLFEPATITRLLGHFQVLLEAIAAAPDEPLAAQPLLTAEERQTILVAWNSTTTPYPATRCIHQLFQEQAARTPDAVAVVCDLQDKETRRPGDKQITGRITSDGSAFSLQLTYGELNRRADQLANHLIALGVAPGTRVGVCVERSVELVIGLMGIAKAGGAYVPLDPAYPPERLAFMLDDSGATVVLIHTSIDKSGTGTIYRAPTTDDGATIDHIIQNRVPRRGESKIVNLSADWPLIARAPAASAAAVTPADLLYVIYTSGSTGQPKGVMLDHRGRVNNFCDFNQRFQIGPGDRLLAISSLSFDMSAYDVFGTLTAGGTIILPEPAREHDPAHWAELMLQHDITIWHSAPALLHMLLEYLDERPALAPRALRLVLLGGDWIPVTMPDRLKALVAGVRVISLGGATESSMDSTIYEIERSDPSWKSIPYGQPMFNQRSYILDRHMQPVPIGIAGELYLGGVGLSWGYFARPDLTAERFVPNPWGSGVRGQGSGVTDQAPDPRAPTPDPWLRLYKTGDRACYRAGGMIELLGRMDHQVKIRGLRIELGEIEARLRRHPAVQQCVVVVREDVPDDRQLVAYVVPAETLNAERRTMNRPEWSSSSFIVERSALAADLRAFLAEQLPDYMLPAAFVLLDALPLTPNGKLDRAALPAPETAPRDAIYVPPRTPLEQHLASVWAETLHVEQVGIDDDFFELGGDSFKAIRTVWKSGMGITLLDLFTHPTIRELAQHAAKHERTERGLLYPLKRPAREPARTLVCIPYGGGSAIIYRPLAEALPDDYAVYSIALPGHDLNRDADPLQPIDEIAARCVAEIRAQVHDPFLLYGHCAGVALTLAIARLLEDAGRAATTVYLGGALPPLQLSGAQVFLSKAFQRFRPMNERRLVRFMRSLGGFNEVVDPAELRFVLDAFVHDGQAAADYFSRTFAVEQQKLSAPIVCVVGDRDPLTKTYRERYREWSFFSDSITLAVVSGGDHYFVKHRAAQVAELIVGL